MKDKVIQCIYCGDSCGQEICYACEETAYEMGLNPEEMFF